MANNRIGKVLGAFKTVKDLYPSFQSKEERNIALNNAYAQMQEGLTEIHLSIEEKRKVLQECPKNGREIFK